MPVVYSLGSNLGDRLANLRLAVRELSPYAISPVYETSPAGGPAQPDYLNAVLLALVESPGAALAAAQTAERAAGRVRTVRFGPRTLDVDVVVVDGMEQADEALILPHPRAHERAFVLVPWLDVDPLAVLPGYGPVAQLPAVRDRAGIHRRDDLALVTG